MDLATVQAVKAQDFSCGSFPEGSHQSGTPFSSPVPFIAQSMRRVPEGGKPHKLWGTSSRVKMIRPFVSEIQILQSFPAHEGWGLLLPAALAASLRQIQFCCSVLAILLLPRPRSKGRRKGLHSLSSYLRMNTNISFTPEAAAVLTDFLHQKLGDHLGSCWESAGCSANGSASMGCLPKRLRTLASSNRDLSYLYR